MTTPSPASLIKHVVFTLIPITATQKKTPVQLVPHRHSVNAPIKQNATTSMQNVCHYKAPIGHFTKPPTARN